MDQVEKGNSLLRVLASQDAIESIAALAEVPLDRLISDGLVREIPVLSALVAMGRIGLQVRDALFVKKLARFLAPLARIRECDRARMLEALAQDASARRRTGEHLILLIERQADLEKPAILASVFEAYLRGAFDWIRFKELASAIDACFVDDPKLLAQVPAEWGQHYPAATRLMSAGLLWQAMIPIGLATGVTTDAVYKRTSLGDQLVALVS
jgi:hypothetical protein